MTALAQARTLTARTPQALNRIGLDRPVLAAFAVSRLVVLAAAAVAEGFLSRNPALTGGDGAPILRSLTSWDGWYYLEIARSGYHAAPVTGTYHDYAFLPLYPVLVHILSLPWPDFTGLVAVLFSNAACLVGLGLLVSLGTPYLGRARASRGAAYLALFPFAVPLAMAYAESLFLVLSLGAFLAAERDRRALSGILLVLATLTRLQGAVLILPLGLILLRRDGWRPRASQAWLLLGPLAVAAFFVYVALLTGSASGFAGAQAGWGRTGIGGAAPSQRLVDLLSVNNVVQLVVLCASVFLLVFMRGDRMPLPYALVPILYIGVVFGSGLLESVGRYVALAFPNVWILASRRSQRFQRSWPVVSTALLGMVAVNCFRGFFVP